MKYFIANWKANKNLDEAKSWLNEFYRKLEQNEKTRQKLNTGSVKIIICPPFPLIYPLKELVKDKKNIAIGSQDISKFEKGSFTGEVTGRALEGLAQYSIIGHSERRKYFSESDDDIEKKIIQAQKYHIKPILCIRDEKDKIFPEIEIIAYEPVYAIGTGINESPEKVLEMKKKLHLNPAVIFIYGGSVNETNVKNYLDTDQIDGFLIGGASLDPAYFSFIVSLA